ncbi:MAG: glycoside hydrolase, partial [Clostridia bacterium]|nr:glycoside hydrolase [Clostridia bacterium]
FYPGMPSVAYDDKGHDKNYWRGLTWLNVAYFAVRGLYDYGYVDTAREIKEYILDMCYDLLPDIYENYDSLERKGCGCEHFSWSSAFIIEFILEIK